METNARRRGGTLETASEASSQLEGRYANFFKIGHNAFEFLLDFGQSYGDGGETQYHLRIVTSPAHAKVLLELLRESIGRHERLYGPIPQER